MGTPLYMAPELWQQQQQQQQGCDQGGGRRSSKEGRRSSKAVSDVFSFGVIMWEVIHGRTAWTQYLNESPGLPPKELAADYNAMKAFRPRFFASSLERAAAVGELAPPLSSSSSEPTAGRNVALLERPTTVGMPAESLVGHVDRTAHMKREISEIQQLGGAAEAVQQSEGSAEAVQQLGGSAEAVQQLGGAEAALVALSRRCLEENPSRRPSFAEIRESLGAMMQQQQQQQQQQQGLTCC